ncbi:MAG: 1-phosphofructokinase [Eubacteriales bacterium]|nr:1-phosphofructokinase [Eubacteriales bacterium]
MIYTVTFNPALDYLMYVSELQSEDINRTEKEQLFYGGKGINVSVILTRLGVKNKALGFLAGFSGHQLEDMLNADSIENDFVYLKKGYTRINVKIKSKKEIDINACGPEITADDIQELFKKIENLEKDDCLVLAGSIPKSLPDNIYEKILDKLNGKGIDFVVDATGDLLKNVLKYKPFMIKPNHHELGEIFSTEIKTLDEIKKYGKMLQDMGARNVLISRGKDGAALLDENGEIHTMGNVPGKIVSSVGCGDSMVAGFLAGYYQTKDYAYALKLGSACGNATAFSSSLATKEEIEKMLKNDKLK